MAFGLVDGPGSLSGINNPIVEIFENDGILNFRLVGSTENQIWVYDQSKDALDTATFTAGLAKTIADAMGIPNMPRRTTITVRITKTNITEIAKI